MEEEDQEIVKGDDLVYSSDEESLVGVDLLDGEDDHQELVIGDDLVYSSDEQSLVGVDLIDDEEVGGLNELEVDDLIFGDADANPEGPPDVTVNEVGDSIDQVTQVEREEKEGFDEEEFGTFYVNGRRRSRRFRQNQMGSIRVDGVRRSARLRCNG